MPAEPFAPDPGHPTTWLASSMGMCSLHGCPSPAAAPGFQDSGVSAPPHCGLILGGVLISARWLPGLQEPTTTSSTKLTTPRSKQPHLELYRESITARNCEISTAFSPLSLLRCPFPWLKAAAFLSPASRMSEDIITHQIPEPTTACLHH